MRCYLETRFRQGLDLKDSAALRQAGAELMNVLQENATEIRSGKRPAQAELLVQLALEHYRLGVADNGEPFAVAEKGPNIALMLRGSRDSLRCALAHKYRLRLGHTPTASALANAMIALQGEAHQRPAEPVYLRVAEHEGRIIIDLGGTEGHAIRLGGGAWQLLDRSPVLFRRTALTGRLVEPTHGGDLNLLKGLLNVADESWPLVMGWLVAAMCPNIPHPILVLGGEQGTGKTTAARFLSTPVRKYDDDLQKSAPSNVLSSWSTTTLLQPGRNTSPNLRIRALSGLVDPSPAPLRSQPGDPEPGNGRGHDSER